MPGLAYPLFPNLIINKHAYNVSAYVTYYSS